MTPPRCITARAGVAALYIASGLDPDHCPIFIQSHVTAHAEACWLAGCVTPLGWLERMTQYKDKAGRSDSSERISTGTPCVPRPDGLRHPPL